MEVAENRAVSFSFLPCPADFRKNLILQRTFGERLGKTRMTQISFVYQIDFSLPLPLGNGLRVSPMFGLLPNRRGGWTKARSFVISQGPLPKGNGNERKVRSVKHVNEMFNFQRAPETSEPNGPRAKRLTRIVVQTNTNLRDTLNFPLLA